MLQQTPVARVLPVWLEWQARWPTPADLAGRAVGRGRPDVGPTRLPAPRAAPARGRAGLRDAVTAASCPRTSPSCARCPESVTTPRRRWRRSPSGNGTRCSTRTSDASWPGSVGGAGVRAGRRTERRRATAGRRSCCPTTRTPRRRGAWPSWSSAPSSARHGNRDATPAPWPRSAPGAVPAIRRGPGSRAAVRRTPAPTVRSAVGCSPSLGTAGAAVRGERAGVRLGRRRAARPRPAEPARRRTARHRRRHGRYALPR